MPALNLSWSADAARHWLCAGGNRYTGCCGRHSRRLGLQ